MKLTLSRAQLLEQWRLRAFPEPMNEGSAVTPIDGIDMDAFLEAAALDWYRHLLHTAFPAMLNPHDYAAEITPVPDGDGAMRIDLPDSTVRVLAVRLSCWNADAEIVTDKASPAALRQLSKFTRSGPDAPVAVWTPGSTSVFLYPAPDDGKEASLSKALLVVDTPDTFRLDSAAFTTITPLQ